MNQYELALMCHVSLAYCQTGSIHLLNDSDSDEQPPDDSPVNPMPSTSTQPSCEQTPAITAEQFDRLLLRMEQMEKTMAESQGTQLIPEGVEPPQIPEHQPRSKDRSSARKRTRSPSAPKLQTTTFHQQWQWQRTIWPRWGAYVCKRWIWWWA